ncbi:MAG: lyase family protein, partial [Gaiellaceae bacterium]
GVLARGRVRDAVGDAAWLQAMLDVEAALARASATAGLISEADAETIGAACGAAHYDAAEIGAQAAGSGNPAAPLVKALTKRVEGSAAGHVHSGATSQDVVDSAAMLVAHRALGPLLDDLGGAAAAAARLARDHRATVLAGRTLLQQAVPVTFGLKASSWLVGIVHARGRLAQMRLPAQLGGAAGTLAALGDDALDVLSGYAEELGLPEPVLPWHTRRLPVAELGAALAVAAGFCAKIALDVALLAQTEVGEVRLPEGGASSTMPHKRNPVGPALTRACAAHVRAAAGVLLDLEHEHERAAGAWHAEWKAVGDALAFAGGAAASLRGTLERVEIDAERMRANLCAETMSESERFAPDAREPEEYLGAADAFVDRALAFYRS